MNCNGVFECIGLSVIVGSGMALLFLILAFVYSHYKWR